MVETSFVGFAGFPRRWVRFGWELSQPSSGGVVVRDRAWANRGGLSVGGGRAIGVPPSFSFSLFGLSAGRPAERVGRRGHPESLLEQAGWGGVAGFRSARWRRASRGPVTVVGWPRGAAGFRGGGFSPAHPQFRSPWAKKQDKKERCFGVVWDTLRPGKRSYAHKKKAFCCA